MVSCVHRNASEHGADSVDSGGADGGGDGDGSDAQVRTVRMRVPFRIQVS